MGVVIVSDGEAVEIKDGYPVRKNNFMSYALNVFADFQATELIGFKFTTIDLKETNISGECVEIFI